MNTTRVTRSHSHENESNESNQSDEAFWRYIQAWAGEDSRVWEGREKELLNLGLEVLESGDFQTRWEVAKILPQFGSMAIAPLLEWLADEEEEEELRWFAGSILEQLNQPETITALAEVLRTTDSQELRRLVSQILGSFGVSALPVLGELLQLETHRELAVRALSCIRHRDGISLLLNAIPDRNPQVYAGALEALSCFDDPRVIPALMGGLDYPIAKVRYAAVVGLGVRSQCQSMQLVSSEQVVKGLRDRLWDFDGQVCQQAAIALGRLATVDAAIALQTIVCSASTPETLKVTAIQSLGWIAASPDDPVSEAAALALQALVEGARELSSFEEMPLLEIMRVCGQIEHRELQQQASLALIKWLETDDCSLRVQGAIALSLGYLKQPKAIPSLIKLLSQEDMGVRLHAIAGLKGFGDLAYEQIQAMSKQPELSTELRQGMAIALQEW